MSEKKEPKFVGVPEGPDSVVRSYREQVRARAKAARDARPKIGDLSEADALYDPKRSPPMTIGQVTEGARRMNETPEEQRPQAGLSPETIAGLRDLSSRAAQLRQEQQMSEPEEQPRMPERPAVDREEEPIEQPEDIKREVASTQLAKLDDWEFERLMNNIQHDTINNPEQRKAIEELVEEFDLAKCLATGDWTQEVPVVPDKLSVTYRLVSPYENQAVRLLLYKWIDDDPRLDALAGEIYSLMMIVASIVKIGSTQLPDHLVGPNPYEREFDDKAFTLKYNMVRHYPNPLIHAIGVHSGWYDMRAREAMRVTNLKGG